MAASAFGPRRTTSRDSISSRSRPCHGRRIGDDVPNKAAVLRPGQDQGHVRAADRQPLREQLRRGGEAPQPDRRAARRARLREGRRLSHQRAQSRATHRNELDDPARAVLRRSRRPKRAWCGAARSAGARFRIVRTLAIGVRGDGQGARRRLRMGPVVVVAARPQARQPVGIGSLPHIGGRHADSRARYVRALLSHRLRGQGGELRRYVHGRHSLEHSGATIRSSDKWSRDGGRCKTVSSTQEEIIMRPVHVLAICAMATIGSAASAQEIDWKKVDEAIGRSAAAVSGDVHRYGFPRTDLTVTLDGVTIKPALALGGWTAFKPIHGGAMVMGDLVLLETEINPVMAKLIENGIEITAVHNHVLRANPLTFYMHIGGHGDPVKLATAIRTGLAASKTPLTPPAAPASQPAIDLDTAQLDQIIGAKGQANGGVYQFGVPRRDPISEGGMQLMPAGPLGVATAINFQPTGGGKAAITGDFVLTGDEVNPVIKALRSNGIEVTAVHSHMLNEQPRLFFMHFWANDDAVKLAKGLRAALDKTASAKS